MAQNYIGKYVVEFIQKIYDSKNDTMVTVP